MCSHLNEHKSILKCNYVSVSVHLITVGRVKEKLELKCFFCGSGRTLDIRTPLVGHPDEDGISNRVWRASFAESQFIFIGLDSRPSSWQMAVSASIASRPDDQGTFSALAGRRHKPPEFHLLPGNQTHMISDIWFQFKHRNILVGIRKWPVVLDYKHQYHPGSAADDWTTVPFGCTHQIIPTVRLFCCFCPPPVFSPPFLRLMTLMPSLSSDPGLFLTLIRMGRDTISKAHLREPSWSFYFFFKGSFPSSSNVLSHSFFLQRTARGSWFPAPRALSGDQYGLMGR